LVLFIFKKKSQLLKVLFSILVGIFHISQIFKKVTMINEGLDFDDCWFFFL